MMTKLYRVYEKMENRLAKLGFTKCSYADENYDLYRYDRDYTILTTINNTNIIFIMQYKGKRLSAFRLLKDNRTFKELIYEFLDITQSIQELIITLSRGYTIKENRTIQE